MKPHHGDIKILSSADCVRHLEGSRFGHLACHVKNDIYLVPITFAFEDGYLYSHAKPGKKIEMMRKNPHVCVQTEEVRDFFCWQSVIAWGQFEELAGTEAVAAMRRLIQKIAEKEPEARRSDLEVDLSALLESAVIYRIKIERVSGRSEGFG